MNLFLKVFGRICEIVDKLWKSYKSQSASQLIGIHELSYPYTIAGWENLEIGESVRIGSGATIYATRAKLIIKGHFVAGPGLTIITGDHMPVLGRFIDTVSDTDKDKYDIEHTYDQDVVIEEDVWCGANVTILKGVTIGRGSIIAAGAVVANSIPSYCIAGGVPAKVIKYRLSREEIRIHEAALYTNEVNNYKCAVND